MADYKSAHTGAEIDAGIDKAVTADNNWNLLMDNLGIGRWRKAPLYHNSWGNAVMNDGLAKYYTTYHYFMANAFFTIDGDKPSTNDIYFSDDDFFGSTFRSFNHAFANMQNASTIYLPNMKVGEPYCMFNGSKFTKILVKEGCSVIIGNNDWAGFVASCPNLTEIGAFDMSNKTDQGYALNILEGSPNVKSIHCKHWKISFDIRDSTAFEESDLVEIISNLDEVTTTRTLTMGATNLAKLTDAEKQVATDKGWILA